MITLFILLLALGALAIVITGACVFLLDPIIAILIITGVYKLITKLFNKK